MRHTIVFILLSCVMLYMLCSCASVVNKNHEKHDEVYKNYFLSVQLKHKTGEPEPKFMQLSDEKLSKLTGLAENGDKNSAKQLFLYYYYTRADTDKANYYLNIAGRGGSGIGQYDLTCYYDAEYQTEKDCRSGGYFGDSHVLSPELLTKLNKMSEAGNADAAFRIYQHYRFWVRDQYIADWYKYRAAELGHEVAYSDLRKRFSDEHLQTLYANNPLKKIFQ